MRPAIRRHTIATAYTVCGRLTRHAARNFYLAFLLLPAEMRRSIYAAYAFSRRVDDIADGHAGAAHKQRLLDRCRADVRRAAAGGARRWDPVTLALADAMDRHAIPPEYLLGLIDGMEMDLRVSRYPRFDDLFQYCYRAASLVGLICIEIFGYRGAEEARQHAIDLGIAMQLTNILRDVAEDATRGRVYLPGEDLAAFGVSEGQLSGRLASPAFRELMKFQVRRARGYFDRGRELLPLLDPGGRLCVQTLGAIYSRLLDLIEAREYDVLSGRVRISNPAKLKCALGAWVGAAPSW